jgi:hypothetical protein
MNNDQLTREQYRALFQLWINRANSNDTKDIRPIVSIRLQPRTNHVWVEIGFLLHEKPYDTGSSYSSFWIYLDREGYAYNDNPSDYERFERSTEHRARIDSYPIIWEG